MYSLVGLKRSSDLGNLVLYEHAKYVKFGLETEHPWHMSLLAWRPRNLKSKLSMGLGSIWQVDNVQITEDADV